MWSASRDTSGRRVAEWLGSLVALLTGLILVIALIVTRTFAPAGAGVGDPYYPDAGGSGYDALSYIVDVTYDPDTGVLSGSTWVSLRTTQPLDVVHLDLMLGVSEVDVGGSKAGFSQRGSDLAVQLATVVGLPANRAGALLNVRVTYSGRPADVNFAGDNPVYTGGAELLICGEPASASAWFPSNDHPSDPATYDITVGVPTGVEAISVGTLLSHGADPAHPGEDSWHWRTDTPAPTYATMLAVGQYDVETVPVLLDGVERTAVYAVSESLTARTQAMAWLKKSGPAVTALERHLGRYPLDALGGLVPGLAPDWGGMETLGRPVYHPNVVGSDNDLFHELAHQWLGDTVTLRQWHDIFINEAMASYLEWMSVAEEGGPTPQQNFDHLYAASPDSFWNLRLSDPGVRGLFTRVYDRGPMVVHALRVRMGEDAFSRFLADWAGQTGPRSLDDWRNAAEKASPVDVRPLLAAWLDGTSKVPSTTENGFS
jgi:aminopeptidase N